MHVIWTLGLLLALQLGCGGSGNRSPEKTNRPAPTSAPSPSPGPEQDYETNVGFGLLDAATPGGVSCGSRRVRLRPATLDEGLVLDGNSSEWEATKPPQEDSSSEAGLDIISNRIAFAQRESRSVVAGYVEFANSIGSRLAESQSLVLEFGRYIDGRRVTSLRQERLYKIDKLGFHEYRGGVWQRIVNTDIADMRIGQDSIEWRIDARQLDQVTSASPWWFRVSSQDGEAVDALTPVFFSNTARTSHSLVWECELEAVDESLFTFQEVRHAEVAREDAELVFGVARLALESVRRFVETSRFPLKDLTVRVIARPEVTSFLRESTDSSELSYGLAIGVDHKLLDRLRSGRIEQLYLDIVAKFARVVLTHQFPQSAELGLALGQGFLVQLIAGEQLGLSHKLSLYHEASEQFLAAPDSAAPVGLVDRYERSQQPFESESEKNEYVSYSHSKLAALVYLLDAHTNPEAFFEAWYRAGEGSGSPMNRLRDALADAGMGGRARALWHGWVDGSPYDDTYHPQKNMDEDMDGLPNVTERKKGTNPARADSDGDGWTDLAEIVLGTNPDSDGDTPEQITADGYFGDWQQLLPTQIRDHSRQVAPECPGAARIKAHAAIGHGSTLLIAGLAGDSWNGSEGVSWEAQIQVGRPRSSFILRANTSEFFYRLYSLEEEETLVLKARLPRRGAVRAAEWAIDFSKIGLDVDFDRPRGGRVKITTILENSERSLCDVTPWFYPLVSL